MASDALFVPFSQQTLDDSWEADRLYPSGGVESVTFGGRDDVAAVRMDSTQASGDGSWWGFEGLKQVAEHGRAVQVDAFIPSDFQDHPVNAGFWASDAPTVSAFPIIAFRNDDEVDAGFYTWNSVSGWAATGIEVDYDAWNTLQMSLNLDAGVVDYLVNGTDAGTIVVSGDGFGQVFLNQYNFGAIRENAVDYTVHWHAGDTGLDMVEPDPVESDPVEPDPVESDPVEPDPVEPVLAAPVDHGTPSFGDVIGGSHAAAIDLLYRYGVTTGVSDTSYDPSGDLSRGQMATSLVRLLALADPDVARPDSHDAAMQLLVERGIFVGHNDGELNLAGTLTRGQAASVMVRVIEDLTGEVLPSASDRFPDAGDAHGENIAKLATLGVVNGFSDGTYRPGVELRRDQMASFIVRSIEELIEAGVIADLDA